MKPVLISLSPCLALALLGMAADLAMPALAQEGASEARPARPIGRHNTGESLMAWTKGASRPEAPRRIHLGLRPGESAWASLSEEVEWHGLVAPLESESFPPTGKAFETGQAYEHAVWRWIGLTAPEAVHLPDTAAGRALGRALQQHAPGEVGRVRVFVEKLSAEGQWESTEWPWEGGEQVTAVAEMQARTERSPETVLAQVAQHYGDRFGGGYIDALAVMARMDGGLEHRAAALARTHLEKSPDLPKGASNIAGNLLYTRIDEPWARQRVLAVADMAFDASGEPLEAMPSHNEMSDQVFMGSPLLAEAGRISGEKRYYDQALQNYRFIAGLCRRPDGIYRHSPLDEGAWGRGNGFPALGLALTLQPFPESHEGFAEMRDALVAHLEALAPHQDEEGMWHQIIDRPDSYAELTSTSMISYAIAVALEKGWLPEVPWRGRLEAAWAALKRRVSSDGRVFFNVCTSTGKQTSLEDYYLREAILGPDGRGAAMVMILAQRLSASRKQ